MKVGNPAYRGDEFHLPIEVISLICQFIGGSSNIKQRQTNLASCCLVSKEWCSVFVRHLYERPLITPGSFDKFTRTICSSVSSRTKRVGLEDFVKHLDLSPIAYESSKSLTARLIRRLSRSLESFASPAITFGVSSLAPLSKCVNLRTLDLSHDGYRLDINQILDSVGHLEHLTTLKLPTDTFASGLGYPYNPLHWPKYLKYLQMPFKMWFDDEWWDKLVESWPSSLETLNIRECHSFEPFKIFKILRRSASSIKCLEIGLSVTSKESEELALHDVLSRFPAITMLTLPALVRLQDDDDIPILEEEESSTADSTSRGFRIVEKEGVVEVLTLTRPLGFSLDALLGLDVGILEAWVKKFPLLRRLNIPKELMRPGDAEQIVELSKVLEARVSPDKIRSAGLFAY